MACLREVIERREALVGRSEALRAELAANAGPLRDALGRADGAIRTARRIVFSPFTLAAAAGLVLALRPRRILAVAGGAWSAWRFMSPLFRAVSRR